MSQCHLKTSLLSHTYNFLDMMPLPYPQPLPSYLTFAHLVIRFYFVGSSLEIKKMFISLPSNQKTITNLNCLK